MPSKAEIEKRISDILKEIKAKETVRDVQRSLLEKTEYTKQEKEFFKLMINSFEKEIDSLRTVLNQERKSLADLDKPTPKETPREIPNTLPPRLSFGTSPSSGGASDPRRTLAPLSPSEREEENREYQERARSELAKREAERRPAQFAPFQTRITVPNTEGVDSTALLRHHAIDRILEENRRGYTPFPGDITAPPDPLQEEARTRTVDLARGVDRTSQRMSALQTIQERILQNAERHGELSPEGRERLNFAAGVPNRNDLIKDAKAETLALMELIKKRNYDRYEFERSRRLDELNKKLTGRMALGKTWDSGDVKALHKFKIHEEHLMKELQDKLDDTEKSIFREALNNAHARDSSTRQRVMQGVDRELQGNAQGFGQAQALAHERRAQSDSEYQNYLHRLRLMHEAGGEQRQRAQEIIAEQMRRFEDARNHNTAQVNALANFAHGQPMPFIRPFVSPDGMPAPTAPRNNASDLLGLGLQGAGTALDLFNRYRNGNLLTGTN